MLDRLELYHKQPQLYLPGLVLSHYIDYQGKRLQTNVSLRLYIDQGEGIGQQLKFAAKQLDDRVTFHTSCMSVDQNSDLPTPSEHDQT